MFCSNCGAKLSDSAKFCPVCGERVTTTEESNTPISSTLDDSIPPSEREETSMMRLARNTKYIAASVIWRLLVIVEGIVLIPCAVKFFNALSDNTWLLEMYDVEEFVMMLSAPPYIILVGLVLIFLGAISDGFWGSVYGLLIIWFTVWATPKILNEELGLRALEDGVLLPGVTMYNNIPPTVYPSLWVALILVITVLVLQIYADVVKMRFGEDVKWGLSRFIARHFVGGQNNTVPENRSVEVVEKPMVLSETAQREKRSQRNSALIQRLQEANAEGGDTWICPYCKSRNSVSDISCKDCGRYK